MPKAAAANPAHGCCRGGSGSDTRPQSVLMEDELEAQKQKIS